MEVKKEKRIYGLSVILKDGSKSLQISLGGNYDLYWSIYDIGTYGLYSDDKAFTNHFTVTKENYQVYLLFEELFNDIENFNFDERCFFPELDGDYKKATNYYELFNKKERKITWYSDETSHDVANYFEIKQEPDYFRIDFYTQSYKEGYDRDFGTNGYIPVRIRNLGSRYDPFNIIFMKMYKQLKDIDDVYDDEHQIHMEEYVYNNSLARIKKESRQKDV